MLRFQHVTQLIKSLLGTNAAECRCRDGWLNDELFPGFARQFLYLLVVLLDDAGKDTCVFLIAAHLGGYSPKKDPIA